MTAAPLNTLMADPGVSTYYDDSFIAVIEDHLTYLRSHPSTTPSGVDAQSASKYQGDFYGLLVHLAVPYYLHRVVMRMNGFASPDEAPDSIRQVLLPDTRVVDVIRQAHVAVMKSSV